jgi:hypothetical protein
MQKYCKRTIRITLAVASPTANAADESRTIMGNTTAVEVAAEAAAAAGANPPSARAVITPCGGGRKKTRPATTMRRRGRFRCAVAGGVAFGLQAALSSRLGLAVGVSLRRSDPPPAHAPAAAAGDGATAAGAADANAAGAVAVAAAAGGAALQLQATDNNITQTETHLTDHHKEAAVDWKHWGVFQPLFLRDVNEVDRGRFWTNVVQPDTTDLSDAPGYQVRVVSRFSLHRHHRRRRCPPLLAVCTDSPARRAAHPPTS